MGHMFRLAGVCGCECAIALCFSTKFKLISAFVHGLLYTCKEARALWYPDTTGATVYPGTGY
eukprot:SAG11_NODE_1178_length_5598_cov_4.168394_7_plen_62_part_00